MAQRQGGLLAQIEADVVDHRVPLSSLLQKCKLLGGRAGSQKLRDWAYWELNGYEGADALPVYRHVHTALMAVITNRAGYNPVRSQVRPDVFGDQIGGIIREVVGDIEDALIPYGIGMLEDLANQGTDTHRLQPAWSSVMIDTLNRFNTEPNSVVREVYWSVPNASMHGILVRVRSALVDLVTDLTTVTPQDQDVPDRQAADRAVQFIFNGDRTTIHFGDSRAGDIVTENSGNQYNISDVNGNVAAGSSDFTQNYSTGFASTKVRQFAELVTQVADLLGLDTSQQTELAAANTELHDAIDAPKADKGRIRRAWDVVMGIVKLGTNKAVTTAAINIGNQAADDLGAAIHHLHP
jgi:hypothetical protein